MNDSTLFSTTASMGPRRAIMCPGCCRLHHGPGAYCGTACTERVREEVHRVVTAEVPLVVHTPAAIVLGHLLVDLQAMVTKRLVGELSGMLTLARARRRAAGYRYWRRRARKARLGYGCPL